MADGGTVDVQPEVSNRQTPTSLLWFGRFRAATACHDSRNTLKLPNPFDPFKMLKLFRVPTAF